jgi:hypothetical protein
MKRPWLPLVLSLAFATAAACGHSNPSVPSEIADAASDARTIAMPDADAVVVPDEAGIRGPLTSVVMHHAHLSRDGAYVDPQITKKSAAGVHLDSSFHAMIDGQVYAQTLFVKNGPGGKPAIIAATEKNNVYALDLLSGAPLFSVTLGTPVAEATERHFNPGNASSDPLGITSTPVIDEAARRIYIGAMTTPDATGFTMQQKLFAISLDDGSPVAGFPVDMNSAVTGFDSTVQNQRGALALLGGIVYVPYGGFSGDEGAYHGWLIGVDATTGKIRGTYQTPALLGGAWGPSGVASDGTKLFISTGNTFGAMTWGGGEAVLSFSAGPVFSGATSDYWAPSNWKTLDGADLDIGGSGVILVDAPGATPSKLAVALGKNGVVYFLDRGNLGGIGTGNGATGEGAFSMQVADAISTVAATYVTAKGTYVVLNSFTAGIGCPAGQSGTINALLVEPGPPLGAKVAWCADPGGRGGLIATTTDGTSEPVVWVIGSQGDDALHAFDGDTGATIAVTSGVGNINRWIAPIVVDGRVIVAGDDAVYAFTAR